MASEDIAICNVGLVRVGGRLITTLEGDQAENTACRTLFPSVVRDRISAYRWRFATKMVPLQLLEAVPVSVYRTAHALPSGVETVWAIRRAGQEETVDFDRFEGQIYTNVGRSETLIAEVTFLPATANWPGYFRTLIELDMAAALAVPLTEDTAKASYYEGKALRQYAQARHLDASTRTAKKIDMGGLKRLHGGRP